MGKDLDGSSLKNYICKTCTRHLKKGNVPPMSYLNGLGMYKYKDDEEKETLNLSEVSYMGIAKNALFQKLYLLPRSRWAAVKDKLINVPIPDDVLQETINELPRLPTKAGVTAVKFKRKKYKTAHKQEYVDPKKLLRVLHILKEKHPEYKNIEIMENFEELYRNDDSDLHNALFGSTESDFESNDIDGSEKVGTENFEICNSEEQENMENIALLSPQECLTSDHRYSLSASHLHYPIITNIMAMNGYRIGSQKIGTIK